MSEVYEEIRKRLFDICRTEELLSQPVQVKARVLTPEEAIGNPEADDFPIQKGKERLMQAEFLGSMGQAFTDQYGNFEGVLGDILKIDLKNNFRRAVFVSTMNAVLRYLGRIENTIHCRDQEPAECAGELVSYIQAKHGKCKIVMVGFQPRMVESLASQFPLRVLDMDPGNIGDEKYHVTIEGPDKTDEAVAWAELLVVTGTTLANCTIENFLGKKPILFYGTTIAGAAYLMDWERFCARGH